MSIEKVLKFGGSSVGTPERIKSVIEIIRKVHASSSIAVVVSAFGGVTDRLIALGQAAARGKGEEHAILAEVMERHKTCARDLIPPGRLPDALKKIRHILLELCHTIEGVSLVKELSPKTLDFVMSFGERLSAFIIAEAMHHSNLAQAEFFDARDFIKTDQSFGNAKVNFKETNAHIIQRFQRLSAIPIITGFIGSSKEHETTTLGRGGSDYTAAIVGAALDVDVIEIWTDVNGVMTADPRKEPYAFSIPEMSYKEAMEMSYFGAKVIHPPTIMPALEKHIPLLIKNTFDPEAQGTAIGMASAKSASQICGISSIDHAALLCIQGSGMIGVCGIAKRAFGALAERGINIIMISQGSSEHSICLAVSPALADMAKKAIESEFALEIQAHLIDEIVLEHHLSVIAVVGEKMCKTPGIAGKLFGALGKNGINVIAITQGSSELNITLVVKKEDEIKAIRAIHEAFFLSPRKTLNVFLVGVGLIGGALLQKLQDHAPILLKDHSLDVRLIGVANSRSMAFHPQGVPLDNWHQVLEQSSEKMDSHAFIERMLHLNLINSVFVDCTSSQTVADIYNKILNARIAIVTPNKKANSGPYESYKNLKDISIKQGVEFFYGSNVGAGLPIISTIKELMRSGDKIIKIEAILSGTLSYLFNGFKEGTVFSARVQEAQQKGYTEPDPRDDLNGKDIARKLLILARECGYALEMEDIAIHKILPEECFNASSVDDFYSKLKSYDGQMAEKRKEGKALRYIAQLEKGKGSISLQAVEPEHPFYHLSSNDNIIAIYSEFYRDNPLVIKGQGAGADVTAGKVFADLVQLGLIL